MNSRRSKKSQGGRRFVFVVVLLLAMSVWRTGILVAEPMRDHFTGLSDEYLGQTRPLMQQFCLDCHSTAVRAGELDLERFKTLAEVRRGTKIWLKVGEMLDSGEMPPKYAKQPPPEERKELRGWIDRYLRAEALANAGDPGLVVLRRLNNAEYTYTICDLTGVDLNPAREFPADGAAGEGFTNTGNALVMSPGLLRKYLEAGKEIAHHAVLLPDGFNFSGQATRRDWTNEILAQIREFYGAFTDLTDLGDGSAVGNLNFNRDTRIGLAGLLPLEKYFAATLSHRKALTRGSKTIEDVARERGLNVKYLRTLWASLSDPAPSLLLGDLRSRWLDAKPQDAAVLAAHVVTWQKWLWRFGPVGLIGRQGGPSRWMEPVNPLVTKQHVCFSIPKFVDGHEKEEVVLSLVVSDAGDGNKHDFVVFQRPRLVAAGRPDILLRDLLDLGRNLPSLAAKALTDATRWGLDSQLFGRHPSGRAIEADSLCIRAPAVIQIRLPGYLAGRYEFVTDAVLQEEIGCEGSVQLDVGTGTPAREFGLFPSEVRVTFSDVTVLFADHRNVSFSRPILIGEDSTARQRIESALDDYRNLFPAALCYAQIIPVDEVLTLTLFYREDDHLVRLMLNDVQRSRLDGLWEELHFVSQSPLVRLTALDLVLEVLARNGLADGSQYDAVLPLSTSFNRRAAEFRKELVEAEPRQVEALVDFVSRAYRRPLTQAEADDLRGLYRGLRQQELPHEEAFRLALARVFVASPFLYRLENAPLGTATAAVSDWELASRLSYFLWSSQPDEELRAVASIRHTTYTRGAGKAGSTHVERCSGATTGHRVRLPVATYL